MALKGIKIEINYFPPLEELLHWSYHHPEKRSDGFGLNDIYDYNSQFSSVQLLSHVRLFATP